MIFEPLICKLICYTEKEKKYSVSRFLWVVNLSVFVGTNFYSHILTWSVFALHIPALLLPIVFII